VDSQATHQVRCPCCKGKKKLPVTYHDDDMSRTVLTLHDCAHCQGRGWIPAEVAVADEPDKSQCSYPHWCSYPMCSCPVRVSEAEMVP